MHRPPHVQRQACRGSADLPPALQVGIVTELMPLGDLHTALNTRQVRWGVRHAPFVCMHRLGLLGSAAVQAAAPGPAPDVWAALLHQACPPSEPLCSADRLAMPQA